MKKQQCVVQAQLCRCVMTLEVKGSSSSGILICANGTFLNFTPTEFAIITGLNYVSNRYDFIFDEGVPNKMVEKYFNGAEIIQKRQLFLAFTERGMPLAIQVWLYEYCSNVPPKIVSKVDNPIPRLLNWKTIASRPRFEFLMNAMFNDDDKVVFKNIEPTKKDPQKDATQHKCSVDSNDDFQDPPPRKSNEHSKKKQKVDSSTPVVKKPLRKKQVDSFDEHTQTRTPAPRAAKADGMKTLIFKSIPT
ncbi:hypothetical protein FXO37_29140 [Capsicum annuum]|nr:hypothetical protein FXO37_29140 [Capsicum annuum]